MDGEKVGEKQEITAKHIIVATGARAREIPPLPDRRQEDDRRTKRPCSRPRSRSSLLVVGAGAIGVEFAYVYHHMGTEVTIVEVQDRLVPVEDKDVSKELERAYKKMGVKVMTGVQLNERRTRRARRSRPRSRRRRATRRWSSTRCSRPSASSATSKASGSTRSASSTSAARSRWTSSTARTCQASTPSAT